MTLQLMKLLKKNEFSKKSDDIKGLLISSLPRALLEITSSSPLFLVEDLKEEEFDFFNII